jgi:uncharacterized membrane protein
VNTAHAVIRTLHIAGGTVGLLAGVLAMTLPKGSVAHARSGRVFAVAMTTMAAAGTVLSIVPVFDPLNVAAGILTLYLVVTAWTTARRAPDTVGPAERVWLRFGAVGTVVIATMGIRAAAAGRATAVPFFAMFGGVLALATVADSRVIRRGGVRGAARVSRHLWRMCTAMLLATLSLFLGQPQVFPPAVRAAGLLPVPPALVAAALLYFAARYRWVPAWRTRRRRP